LIDSKLQQHQNQQRSMIHHTEKPKPCEQRKSRLKNSSSSSNSITRISPIAHQQNNASSKRNASAKSTNRKLSITTATTTTTTASASLSDRESAPVTDCLNSPPSNEKKEKFKSKSSATISNDNTAYIEELKTQLESLKSEINRLHNAQTSLEKSFKETTQQIFKPFSYGCTTASGKDFEDMFFSEENNQHQLLFDDKNLNNSGNGNSNNLSDYNAFLMQNGLCISDDKNVALGYAANNEHSANFVFNNQVISNNRYSKDSKCFHLLV
jgi:hypothetical protein